MNVYLPNSLADHPSLVGIIRMPLASDITYKMEIPVVMKDSEGKYFSGSQIVDMCEQINSIEMTDSVFSIPKNKITDFYPYTYYVLTDGECEPLILKPQHMPNNARLKGIFALSHQPIERYYIEGYKGDFTGRTHNITNLSQMMLPTATNEGLNFITSNANAMVQDKKNNIINTVLGATTSLISGATSGNMVGGALGVTSSVASGLTNILSANARFQDVSLTPSSISSYGTPSTREAFGTNDVRVLKYTVTDVVKNRVEGFVKRYGYKYNNYASVDIKSYKGFIKYISPDVDGKIDNIHINKIIEVLERGVFIE